MNRKYAAVILVLAGLFLVFGCAATQELKTSVTTSVKSKVASITSTVDPAVVSQIPADKREGFTRAEYEVKVASEKLRLAELKSEQASAQVTYINLEEDLAANFRNEAEIDYDMVKMEAIIKEGLGKSKEDNTKIMANLQTKKAGVQADRIKIQAAIEIAKSKIEGLSAQITKMNETINAMKFEENN